MKKFTVEVEIEATEKDGRDVTAAMVRTALREHISYFLLTRYDDGRRVVYAVRIGKARDGGAG